MPVDGHNATAPEERLALEGAVARAPCLQRRELVGIQVGGQIFLAAVICETVQILDPEWPQLRDGLLSPLTRGARPRIVNGSGSSLSIYRRASFE